MATYVMSDIHGASDLFHAMLEKIQFSSEDTLYVLGDVIDRGPHGIPLLLEILEAPNMHLLLGNHEYMMTQYYHPEATAADIRRWNRNGNAPTIAGFQQLSPQQQAALLRTLEQLPTCLEITVGGTRFYLVHGFPGDNVHDRVWHRPEPDSPNPIPDTQLILGHTPVPYLMVPEEAYDALIRTMLATDPHPRILHAPGFWDIDCGCAYPAPIQTLACLRLDDLEEFYTFS